MKNNQAAGAARTRRNSVPADLALAAIGEPMQYTLPNGEVRPAFALRIIDTDTADIRVMCLGAADAEYFPSGHHEVELLQSARRGTGTSTWNWPINSQMRTLWPHDDDE